MATPRLSLSSTGKVVYTLKTPYRDGTTQVAFDPLDFIARLAALVPKPRVNLTRYHGVLDIIDRILAHLRDKEPATHSPPLLIPPPRAPPATLPLFAGKDSSLTAFNQQGRH